MTKCQNITETSNPQRRFSYKYEYGRVYSKQMV
jgi:hypothetical protein